MKKKKIILTGAAVAAVVVIGIGAWTLFGRKSSDGSTENVVYVNSVDNLMNPGSGNGAVNRFAGVVETQKQVDIQQSQDKTVKDIYVEVGQEVSKGDPLFSYDTEKSQEDLEKQSWSWNGSITISEINKMRLLRWKRKKGVQEMMHSLTIQCRFRVPRWN